MMMNTIEYMQKQMLVKTNQIYVVELEYSIKWAMIMQNTDQLVNIVQQNVKKAAETAFFTFCCIANLSVNIFLDFLFKKNLKYF